MRVEAWVFAGLAAVLAPWAIVYVVTSNDEAGKALLVLTAVGFLFVAVFLAVRGRTVGPRPEDDPDGVAVEGDDLGLYPASSIWPVTLAVAATIIAFGLAFSGWVALPGVAQLIFAVVGWAVEVQRSRL